MSLDQLDAFLAHSCGRPELNARTHDHENPLDLASFLALARKEGFDVEESDVLAALEREEASLTDAQLQERAAVEARRLRHFIPG
jgi:hypothetical protein